MSIHIDSPRFGIQTEDVYYPTNTTKERIQKRIYNFEKKAHLHTVPEVEAEAQEIKKILNELLKRTNSDQYFDDLQLLIKRVRRIAQKYGSSDSIKHRFEHIKINGRDIDDQDSPVSTDNEKNRIRERIQRITDDLTSRSRTPHKYSRTDIVTGLDEMRNSMKIELNQRVSEQVIDLEEARSFLAQSEKSLDTKIARHVRAHHEYEKAMHIYNNLDYIEYVDMMEPGQRPPQPKSINDLEIEQRRLRPLHKWVDNDKEIYLFKHKTKEKLMCLVFDNTNVTEWKYYINNDSMSLPELVNTLRKYRAKVVENFTVEFSRICTEQSRLDNNVSLDKNNWAVTLIVRDRRSWKSSNPCTEFGHAQIAIESIGRHKPGYYAEIIDLIVPENNIPEIQIVGLDEDKQGKIAFSQKSKTWSVGRKDVMKMLKKIEWEIEQQKCGNFALEFRRLGRPRNLESDDFHSVAEFEDSEAHLSDMEKNIDRMGHSDLFLEKRGSKLVKRISPENCITWVTNKLLMLGIKLPRSTFFATFPKQYTSSAWRNQFPLEESDDYRPASPATSEMGRTPPRSSSPWQGDSDDEFSHKVSSPAEDDYRPVSPANSEMGHAFTRSCFPQQEDSDDEFSYRMSSSAAPVEAVFVGADAEVYSHKSSYPTTHTQISTKNNKESSLLTTILVFLVAMVFINLIGSSNSSKKI